MFPDNQLKTDMEYLKTFLNQLIESFQVAFFHQR